MANFAHYFNSSFASCRHLANAHDQHRVRNVRIYQIPGEVECVGVTDGVDKWIAPVIDELFSINIKKLMRDLQDGKRMTLPVEAIQTQPKRARRALIIETDPLLSTEPAPAFRSRPGRPEARSRTRPRLI